jgi:hypothetical protein
MLRNLDPARRLVKMEVHVIAGRNDLAHSVPFTWRDGRDPAKTTQALYRVRNRQIPMEACDSGDARVSSGSTGRSWGGPEPALVAHAGGATVYLTTARQRPPERCWSSSSASYRTLLSSVVQDPRSVPVSCARLSMRVVYR